MAMLPQPSCEVSSQVLGNWKHCIEELEKWQSVISRDAYMVSKLDKSRVPPPLTRPVSFIAPDGRLFDPHSLHLAIGEQSAKFFHSLEENHSMTLIRPPKHRHTLSPEKLAPVTIHLTGSAPTLPSPRNSNSPVPFTNVTRKRSGTAEEVQDMGLLDPDLVPTAIREKRAKPHLKKRVSSAMILDKLVDLIQAQKKYPGLLFEQSLDGLIIMGGTAEELVLLLTRVSLSDLSYVAEFLVVYHYFVSCDRVLDHLKDSFDPQARNDQDSKSVTVNTRVIHILKKWMNNYPVDFHDYSAVEKLKEVLNHIGNPSLYDLFQAKVLDCKRFVPSPAPRSIKDDSETSIMFVSCVDTMAQQLTLLEQKCFHNIQVHELRGQRWTRDDAAKAAPALYHCIRHFNRVSYWCATEIVLRSNLKQRVSALKRVINIAQKCVLYNNFNTALAIIGSLGFAAIKRLKRTWRSLPSKYIIMYNDLKELFNIDNNYRPYKKLLISQPPPIIPYLGVYLRDLTFLELGNPDYLIQDKGILNYDKLRMISSVIVEFQTYQAVPYDFEEIPAIQRQLANHMVSFDDDRLYDLSVILEPPTSTMRDSGSMTKDLFRMKKR